MNQFKKVNRRDFLRLGMASAASVPAVTMSAKIGTGSRSGERFRGPFPELEEVTIAELQQAMAGGHITAQQLARQYLRRIRDIDQGGPMLKSVIEINPDALEIAAALDQERRQHGPRGPLHGIPILIKDNIATDDQMQTAAGSLALVGHKPAEDATVAARLREAGAVILGKANLSEWANFRSFQSSSGWSGRRGQGRNPYILDRNPCGSSSGSAQAVSANLIPVSLGTETDGSIVCPSSANGIVGIKPTVGLTSRFNVIPISETQDTVGPHGRTVADAATVLGALTGVDPLDPATAASDGHFYTDYTQFLDPNALHGARIGVARDLFFFSPETTEIANTAVAAMQAAGAVIIDPLTIPPELLDDGGAEFNVLLYEFKDGINKYLSRLGPGAPQTLADLIAFNIAHADQEMLYFGQEIFELAQTFGPLTDPAYLEALQKSHFAAIEGINQLMDDHNLAAIVAPTGSPAWPTDLVNGDHFLGGSSSLAARAGFPLLSVPAGFSFGLPVNITFMGRAFSEPKLIALAYAFEQATQVRQAPQFMPTLE
ncbi:MAG: amidase [Anaerolineaceae bacterium]|nr:amidase [Anaerolineaceae bacterium]